jgi:MtN3 and saliva related transmembrane protein
MLTFGPMLISLVGIIAACMTTGSWIPQALQTIKTRSARDFAWSYLGLFGGGVGLWLVYGVLRQDVALIGANLVTFVLVARIALVKRQSERDGP